MGYKKHFRVHHGEHEFARNFNASKTSTAFYHENQLASTT